MKTGAHILLLGMLMLAVNPLINLSHAASQQVETCCGGCCCDGQSQDGAEQKQCQDNEQDQEHPCDASCDCGCHFHLNAIDFQFNNGQLAQEQEYFYGTYHNDYHFEFLHKPVHPPRLG